MPDEIVTVEITGNELHHNFNSAKMTVGFKVEYYKAVINAKVVEFCPYSAQPYIVLEISGTTVKIPLHEWGMKSA